MCVVFFLCVWVLCWGAPQERDLFIHTHTPLTWSHWSVLPRAEYTHSAPHRPHGPHAPTFRCCTMDEWAFGVPFGDFASVPRSTALCEEAGSSGKQKDTAECCCCWSTPR